MVLKQVDVFPFLEGVEVCIDAMAGDVVGGEVPVIIDSYRSRINSGLNLFRNWDKNFYDTMDLFDKVGIDLRGYQISNLEKFEEFLANLGYGQLLGYFREPTGAGKTMEYMFITKALDVPTLILVPRLALIDQNLDILGKLGFDPSDVGVISGNRKDFKDKKVVLCTNLSAISFLDSTDPDIVEFRNSLGLVVVDEVHKALGDKTHDRIASILDSNQADSSNLFSNSTLVVGYTATPRLRYKYVGDRYITEIGNVKYGDLISEGFLVPLRIHTVDGYIENDFDYESLNEVGASELLEKNKIFEKLLDKYEDCGGRMRTAVYCATIEDCAKFLELAEERGFRGAVFTSKDSNTSKISEFEESLDKGKIDFLIGVDKFTEGWDYPNLEAVMLARFSLSQARIIQAVGRGMRPNGKKDECVVFQVDWRRKEYNTIPNSSNPNSGGGSASIAKVEVGLVGVGLSVEKCFASMEEDCSNVIVNPEVSPYLKLLENYSNLEVLACTLNEFKNSFGLQNWLEFDFDLLKTEEGKEFRLYLETFLNINSEVGIFSFSFEHYFHAMNALLVLVGLDSLSLKDVIAVKIKLIEEIDTIEKFVELEHNKFLDVFRIYGFGNYKILNIFGFSKDIQVSRKVRAMIAEYVFGYDEILDVYMAEINASVLANKFKENNLLNTPAKFMAIDYYGLKDISVLGVTWARFFKEFGIVIKGSYPTEVDKAQLCSIIFKEGDEGYDSLDGVLNREEIGRDDVISAIKDNSLINTPRKMMGQQSRDIEGMKFCGLGWKAVVKLFGLGDIRPEKNKKHRAIFCLKAFNEGDEGYDELQKLIDNESIDCEAIIVEIGKNDLINTPAKFMAMSVDQLKEVVLFGMSWKRIFKMFGLLVEGNFPTKLDRAAFCLKVFNEGNDGYEKLQRLIDNESIDCEAIIVEIGKNDLINTPSKFMSIQSKDFKKIRIFGKSWKIIMKYFGITISNDYPNKNERQILCDVVFKDFNS